ncbi:MAG: heavy-metal-associated domain-containing protein [Prolixibacteraceae bacterium]|nr:heavy-metal-associated domain-containing protein [Prolixibacteraceae bacterium]
MKTVKFIIVALLAITLGMNSFAQMTDHSKMNMSGTKTENKMDMASTKTETIKVWGKCESCQERIEKAAKTDGVSKASWDKDSKLLTLTYDPSKVKSDDIQKKIAAVGHDTEKLKADDRAYAKLPGCCQYERKK